MNKPTVAIIILNWNGWEDTLECLNSLEKIEYPNYDVLVVDNNSSDGSSKIIKENYPDINLIKNEKNYGFAEGNNIGMKYAMNNSNPDYILLLNNDTIVDKDFLTEIVSVGESDKEIGILGPKIYYYGEPDKIWSVGGKISWKSCRGIHIGLNEIDNGQYEEKREVEYINGCAFLIKTEVIKKIGLMDKKFFLYFEETDLALRASEVGYKSIYVPKAKIWHKISKSGGGIKGSVGLYYITRNRWLFMKKWAKKSDYWFFVVYQALGALILPVFLSMYYCDWKLFGAYYRGLSDGLTIRSNNE
jgi:GT2 family glycosyltransferase